MAWWDDIANWFSGGEDNQEDNNKEEQFGPEYNGETNNDFWSGSSNESYSNNPANNSYNFTDANKTWQSQQFNIDDNKEESDEEESEESEANKARQQRIADAQGNPLPEIPIFSPAQAFGENLQKEIDNNVASTAQRQQRKQFLDDSSVNGVNTWPAFMSEDEADKTINKMMHEKLTDWASGDRGTRPFSSVLDENPLLEAVINMGNQSSVVTNPAWRAADTEKNTVETKLREEAENEIREAGGYDALEPTNAARRAWRQTANDRALINLANNPNEIDDTGLTGKELASKLAEFNDDGSVKKWYQPYEREGVANDYMNSKGNMKFWYDNGLTNYATDVAPYLDDDTKNILSHLTTLAKQNGGEQNFWVDTDLANNSKDKIAQLNQAIKGPGLQQPIPDKTTTGEKSVPNYQNAWESLERQGGDTGNYGKYGDRMYDDQDLLWFQMGYKPWEEANGGETVFNPANALGITKGNARQSLDDFENENFRNQIIDANTLMEKNPALMTELTGVNDTGNLNRLSQRLVEAGISPMDSMRKWLIDNVGTRTNSLGGETINVKEAIDKLKSQSANNEDSKRFDSNYNTEIGLMNTLLAASDMANRGEQALFNPNEEAVANLINYTQPKGDNTNKGYNIYNPNEDIGLTPYSNWDNSALINQIAKLHNNPMTSADNEGNYFDKDAVREAIRRAKRRKVA